MRRALRGLDLGRVNDAVPLHVLHAGVWPGDVMEIKDDNLEYLLRRVMALVAENRDLKDKRKKLADRLRRLVADWKAMPPYDGIDEWIEWAETAVADLEN